MKKRASNLLKKLTRKKEASPHEVPKENLNRLDSLYYAIQANDPDKVRKIITSPDFRPTLPYNGLITAMELNHHEIIRVILENTPTLDSVEVLYSACRYGDTSTLTIIFDRPEVREWLKTPGTLQQCLSKTSTPSEIINLILEFDEKESIGIACVCNNAEVVDSILGHPKIKKELKKPAGTHWFHHAIMHNNVPAFAALLECGIKPRDSKLHQAHQHGEEVSIPKPQMMQRIAYCVERPELLKKLEFAPEEYPIAKIMQKMAYNMGKSPMDETQRCYQERLFHAASTSLNRMYSDTAERLEARSYLINFIIAGIHTEQPNHSPGYFSWLPAEVLEKILTPLPIHSLALFSNLFPIHTGAKPLLPEEKFRETLTSKQGTEAMRQTFAERIREREMDIIEEKESQRHSKTWEEQSFLENLDDLLSRMDNVSFQERVVTKSTGNGKGMYY